ncbi:MAG: two-component sensor histidine kinase [Planctomycetes bacterium]|nr:two-component sensor histidine kinase [Planctomycetota bacterium]
MVYAALAAGGLLLALATALWMRGRARGARKLYLDEARRTREEEQSALMSTLAGGLAHEIRNPLSTLSMNLQLLGEEWSNPVTEREQRSRKKIDVLLREAKRLEDVLNEFLAFSAGHKLNVAPANLNDIAGELLDFLAPQAERSRIRLRRSLAADLPRVEADASLLRGAILNLLVNAQQAMPKGGEIHVATERIDGDVLLRVGDTGEGIAPENLDKIFNLYFSTKPGGTGLGLPMAKRIVEEHGGSIEVRSEPGRGTVFTIRIPARPPNVPGA